MPLKDSLYLCIMAKIIIKNGPKDINQLAKLLVDVSTGQVDVPGNEAVDVTRLQKKENPKMVKK